MQPSKWGKAIDEEVKYKGSLVFKSFLTGMGFGALLMFILLIPSKVEASDANNEIYCLAQNIYFEAGNQPLAGKIAVTLVRSAASARALRTRVSSPRRPSVPSARQSLAAVSSSSAGVSTSSS